MKMECGKSCVDMEETTEILSTNDRNGDLLEDTATPKTSLLLEGDADDSWEDQLNICKQRIEELQEEYSKSYLEIGRVLIKAREVYKGHGKWVEWLKGNAPFSVRHAQRLIRVAEMFDGDDAALVSQMGLTSSKAYILTKVSRDDMRKHFLGNLFYVGNNRSKYVRDMTKRELEIAVSTFLRRKLVTTDHEKVTSNKGEESPKRDRVEMNFEELRKILNRTITSIKDSSSDNLDSWISELYDLYHKEVDQLLSASE